MYNSLIPFANFGSSQYSILRLIARKGPVIENVDWSLHWIEFGVVSLDVVEAVLVCPVESVSPHELIQITGQLADCRSLHGFKSTHQDCFDNIQRHNAEFYPV
jgi:hypothetical protein